MKKRTQTLLLILGIAALFGSCQLDKVAPATIADFELADSTLIVGQPVTFNNLSRYVDNSRFVWNFGNGDSTSRTDTGPVSYVYSSTGSFSVELIAFNKEEHETSKRLSITIGDSMIVDPPDIPLPIAAFTVDSMICQAPCTVQFTDSSQNHDPSKNSWQLDSVNTNEGGTSFSHTYINPGIYTVTLTVKNEVDSMDTASKIIQVLREDEDPVAIPNFTIVDNGCTFPCEVTLINQSSGAVRFEWDFFLDGVDTITTSVSEQIPYSASQPGEIPVRLTAYASPSDMTGMSLTDTILIAMPTAPVANFEILTTPCVAPCQAKFINLSSGADSITFDFDYNNDSETVTQQTDTFYYEYTVPGRYIVSLTAYKAGISNPIVHTDTIDITEPIALPVANFTFSNNGCTAPCDIQFNEDASNEVAYRWNFGDGSAEDLTPNPIHTYTSANTYTASLTVYNSNGDSASHSEQITIIAPSTPGMTYQFPLGDADNQEIWDVTDHPNGGYMMAGHTTQGGVRYGWVVRVAENGIVLWDTVHRDASRNINEFRSIEAIGSDEFVVAGFSESNTTANKRRGWVLVLDSLGAELQDNEVPVQHSSQFQAIYPTANGGFVAVGRTQDCGSCVKEGLIVELGSNLNVTSTVVIGTNTTPFYEGFFNTVTVKSDGYAYVGGHSKPTAATDDWDAWIAKYNVNTNTVDLDTTYGDAILAEDIWDVTVNTAGNLVFCGNQNNNTNQEDLWLMEMTPSGAFLNQGNFPQSAGNSNSFGITTLPSGGYALTGYVKTTGLGEQLALFTVNSALSSATLLNTFGSTVINGDDRGRAVLPTSDGGYFIVGFTESLGSGGTDGYYLRTDMNGIVQ